MPAGPISRADRPTAYELDSEANEDVDHGVDGHSGYKCGQCALASGRAVVVYPDTLDFWQDLQIAWQEDCDVIFAAFDDSVATHFPNHLAVNCKSCPVKPKLPVKPEPPNERRHINQSNMSDW